MSDATRTTHSVDETRAAARELAEKLGPGSVLALCGDLGAGKTTFVQGLAEGLRLHDTSQVLSPTYTLVNEYPGEGPALVHIDFYRLEGVAAGAALGLEEQIDRRDAIIAIEWAELLPDLIPPEAIWIRLSAPDATTRVLSISGPGT
jgi:tRNA threonylcarbamoyladenosine biosynthesis protein TsaE